MRRGAKYISLIFFLMLVQWTGAGQSDWRDMTFPSVEEAAKAFHTPPVEYGMTLYWGWNGSITEEVIARDLDTFRALNIRTVTLEPGYEMDNAYLSPGWFETVKLAVELAAQRNMRIWLVDDGKYPSGFAGGKFSSEYPDLRMQALTIAERFDVKCGQTLSRSLPPQSVSAIAINKADNSSQMLAVENSRLEWTAPDGDWQVLLVEHQFRTSPTRSVNNIERGKDTSNSLCDYLDAKATGQFIALTHEQYKKYVGPEFGRTVLGFRGDEPDYSIDGIPWTPRLFADFEQRKGYDVTPYTAAFFAPRLTEEQKRAKADYWDVWSDLFSENFFCVQAKWCQENNLQYLVHLNKEDDMQLLIAHEGDFFKAMRHVQMPGIDTIWNQIWPGKVADFPKYASSAAHLFGRPGAFTESFAAYRTRPNIQQAKWVLDYQFVRGINRVEVMFAGASSGGQTRLPGWMQSEQSPEVALYINRTSYLLSQGRPAAQIALYHPTASLWLGDKDANASALAIAKALLEHQRDFDFVDEQALCSILRLEERTLTNLSEQSYRAVIIPSITAISKTALGRLRKFADAGGLVVFAGRTPSLVFDKTFLHAEGTPDLSWALKESSGELTERLIAALPPPDVAIKEPCTDIKYTHRRLSNGDLYFFFNESTTQKYAFTATLAETGQPQVWNASDGSIKARVPAASGNGLVSVALELQPSETTFIVIGPSPNQNRTSGNETK